MSRRVLSFGAPPHRLGAVVCLGCLLLGAPGMRGAGPADSAATRAERPPARVFSSAALVDVRRRGAVADGSAKNTPLLNALIDEIAAGGGGTLFFPAGTYLTGTLYLRSNVTLELGPGATLLGTTDIADYPENAPPRPTDRLEYARHALIYAAGQHDVAIRGTGRIVGQGDSPNFDKHALEARGVSPRDAYLKRPYGLGFVGCRRVRVEGVTLENLAFWTQHYLDCDDVTVRGVSVHSRKRDANNDGIDIDGSRNVRVSDCHFNVGDDAICLKAAYRDCENVVVTNCTASSLANGVKLGTASNAGYRNITISNIALDGIGAAGIALEVVDGGTLDGVTLTNFTMRDVGAAIFVRLGDNARRWTTDQAAPAIGIVRNIAISHLVAEQRASGARGLSCSITGLPGRPVENVALSDIRIRGTRSPAPPGNAVALANVPEAANGYPECSMFGPLPSYGLFIRHVHGLTLRDIQLDFAGADERSAIVCDDVERLFVDGLQTNTSHSDDVLLDLNDVRSAVVSSAKAWNPVKALLRVSGTSRDIVLSPTLLDSRTQAVESAPEARGAVILR